MKEDADMSKHNNFNSDDTTIQPADNVEREVNGVYEKREKKETVVVSESKKEEQKPVEQPVEKVVNNPAPAPVVNEKPAEKTKTYEEEFPLIDGYRPKPGISKNPVEISARSDYMDKLRRLRKQEKK